MAEYGITDKGFNIKRMDTIMSEIHADLKADWGVDTTINDQSFLNSFIKATAAQIARTWEMGQDVYYSQYPSTAEGISLDNAMQFGGVTRLEDKRTIYPIACTGDDGTNILYGTLIRSVTTPAKDFQCLNLQTISRDNFRKMILEAIKESEDTVYSIDIDGTTYTYTRSDGDTAEDILAGIASAVTHDGITVTVSGNQLILESETAQSAYKATISDNITVVKVTSNVLFESVDYGNITVPTGTITAIVKNVDGLDSITNDITPTAGRLEESDIAARQSYIKRIAIRSKNMIDGMVADIYQNVDGVLSVIGMENYKSEYDNDGRPPHCFEIIVDGGDVSEIAQIIFQRKPPGIRAYGSTSVDISDQFGNIINIGFSRPTYQYVWLQVTLTRNTKEVLAPNYAMLAKEAIMNNANEYGLGEKVILQHFLQYLYKNLTGVEFITIKGAVTDTEAEVPTEYTLDVIDMLSRQKAQFDATRIEVILDGNS